MARIRTIKPEFFTSIVVASVSIPAAMAFVGLWTHCDDAGRAVDDARLIKAALFPLRDEVTPEVVEGYVEELAQAGLAVRYKVDGRKYLGIPKASWEEHQKIDRPRKSTLPAQPEASSKRRRSIVEASSKRRRSIVAGKERIGIGIGIGEGEGKGPPASPPIDRSVYVEQERELRAAALPHETLAFDTLIRDHPRPDALVLELYATACGMHVVRGATTGKAADIADVMRAVAEMAACGKAFSVSLFRGFLRRIADRPPEPSSTEERAIAKLHADIAKRVASEPTQGVRGTDGRIVPIAIVTTDDTPDALERRRQAREDAMARFRAEAGRYVQGVA